MKSERERERRCERTSQHQRAREWRDRKETERERQWTCTKWHVRIHTNGRCHSSKNKRYCAYAHQFQHTELFRMFESLSCLSLCLNSLYLFLLCDFFLFSLRFILALLSTALATNITTINWNGKSTEMLYSKSWILKNENDTEKIDRISSESIRMREKIREWQKKLLAIGEKS